MTSKALATRAVGKGVALTSFDDITRLAQALALSELDGNSATAHRQAVKGGRRPARA